MTTSALTPFLAPSDQVELARLADSDFQGFLSLVQKSSGEPVPAGGLSSVRFRVMDARNGNRDGLTVNDTVISGGQPVRIEELLSGIASTDRTSLAHSLWRLETFDEVKAWLRAIRALVRLAYDVDGELRGHLLLAETIIPMVDTVERKEYVLPNGDMASDAITRNLGVRAKVFALDRGRRVPRGSSDGNSIMERLSRTLNSRAPR